MSLVGVAGALIAAKVGGLMDRGVGIPAQGCFIALGVAAMLVSSLGSHSILMVVLAALLMSLSFQGIGILNQTTLFLLAPKSRSRLNTAFVVNNFIFAAVGSTLAAIQISRFSGRAFSMSSISFSGTESSRPGYR